MTIPAFTIVPLHPQVSDGSEERIALIVELRAKQNQVRPQKNETQIWPGRQVLAPTRYHLPRFVVALGYL